MQCIRPFKANYRKDFGPDNMSITFSPKEATLELPHFQLPCRKCLPCRLNQAREKGIRSFHESQMHEDSIFLTLTYDEQHLESPKLIYKHWQDFAKKLRHECPEKKIPMMVTGEYGELNKRPHWHGLLFNFRPSDETHKYTSDRGDKVFTSENLSRLWGYGSIEYGNVTIDSANYVARYAAKKLVHGNDQDHDYHPIHRTSSKHAIGKSWIERYFKHTFENGFVLLPNGSRSKIPRYYVDWAKKHQPEIWRYYVTEILPKISHDAELKAREEEMQYLISCLNKQQGAHHPLKRSNVKETILKLKFKRLQELLKL